MSKKEPSLQRSAPREPVVSTLMGSLKIDIEKLTEASKMVTETTSKSTNAARKIHAVRELTAPQLMSGRSSLLRTRV
jgi:hypothetical protein